MTVPVSGLINNTRREAMSSVKIRITIEYDPDSPTNLLEATEERKAQWLEMEKRAWMCNDVNIYDIVELEKANDPHAKVTFEIKEDSDG
jgi:hypothetical protein